MKQQEVIVGTQTNFDITLEDETIGIDEVIAIGYLFRTGKLQIERIISLAGPGVNKPRLLKVIQGSCVSEIIQNELKNPTPRENNAESNDMLSQMFGMQGEGMANLFGVFENVSKNICHYA